MNLNEQFARARGRRIQAARLDSSIMAGLVLKDNESGRPIKLAPFQRRWHRLCDLYNRLVIISSTELGKTENISVGRALWEIGKDTSKRIAIVSDTKPQSEKIISSIKQYIERSEEYKEIFPHIKPGKLWTGQSLTVERQSYSKDPSIQSFGVTGAVMGSRLDIIIIDDILDRENTRTKFRRKEIFEWVQSTLISRCTARSKIICVGNAWVPDDLLHEFAKFKDWHTETFPILTELGESIWPAVWPLNRIEDRRRETTPAEFLRAMMCVPRDESANRFKQEWLDVCLARGEGKSLCHELRVIPSGYKIYTGVDLAVQRGDANDWTVFFTIAVHPDETREIIAFERGKLSGPDIVNKVIDVHRRFGSIAVVENNAAQDYILQFVSDKSAVPMIPFCTGSNKSNTAFGIESIFAEMANGKWIIPNHVGAVPSVLQPFIDELIGYNPADHTGDALMACWFAREGARIGNVPVPKAGWSSFDPNRR